MASRTIEVIIAARDNFTGTANKVIGSLNRMDAAAGRVGRGVGQMATGFVRASAIVAGATVTGLGAAAKAAIDFEDAFAGVKKTVDETDLAAAGLSFESLSRDFRDMALDIPIAATEFARLGETAGALGVKAADIDEFVKTTALLGVTTDLTADAAADALGRIGTILKFTGKDYEDFADVLVNLGNKGASTESEIVEITKRFAAEGRAAGLAVPEIAALASATSSLGFEPERGGTALSRVFANMATNIALANAKGKEFSRVTGRGITDLQDSIDRGEGLGIFLDFLEGLKGMSATDAARTLKAAGINNQSDRTIFRNMAENLPFINEQLAIAKDSTGALSEEAQKRFDTVASKIQKFKNALTEAGITLGEGFAPALGNAAEKLSAFLKIDANRQALTQIGQDIGKAIDSINWAEVLSGAKTFAGILKDTLSIAKSVVDALNTLPTEVKAAGLAFLGLNKLSGGLLAAGAGNIISGLGGAALQGAGARLPGVAGRLFAQPVFVTNWPPGMGGPLGAGGKGSWLAGLIPAGIILGVGTAVGSAVVEHFGGVLTEQEKGTGRVIGAIGDLEIVMGQNTAALVRNASALENQVGPPLPPGYKPSFNGPTPLGPPTPPGMGKTFSDPGGRNLMSVLSMDAIRNRALAAGFKPTDAAVQATFERNQQRIVDLQNRIREQEAKTTAAVLTVASELRAQDRTPPVIPPPQVILKNYISATGVTHTSVHVKRYGPTGASRHKSGSGPTISEP